MRDMFPGYYQPTDEEFEKLWSEGLIVLDANVLLDLYRVTPDTREELLGLLEELQVQVWVSHQAAREFQENRVAVIHSQRSVYAKLSDDLAKARTILEEEEGELGDSIEEAFERLGVHVKEREEHQPQLTLGDDPIRDELDALLDERVGPPYDDDQLKGKKQEAASRYAAKVPPGYMDEDEKEGDRKYGDAVLWFQTLDKAEAEGKPVILVTSEEKEDWWLKRKGRILGPRPEMVAEMRNGPGVLYYQYNPYRFLEFGWERVGGEASEEAVGEIRSLPRLLPVDSKITRLQELRQRRDRLADEIEIALLRRDKVQHHLRQVEDRLEDEATTDERAQLLAEARDLRAQAAEASERVAGLRMHLDDVEGELTDSNQQIQEQLDLLLTPHNLERLERLEGLTPRDIRSAIQRRLDL